MTLKSSFLQLGADLEEAGRANGGSFGYTLRHILVPLMLLTTGESEPLSIMQLGYLMAEDYSAASVVGSILVGLGVLLALMMRKSG